jgi:hypothetical protein
MNWNLSRDSGLEHHPRVRIAQLGLSRWSIAVFNVADDSASLVRAVGRDAFRMELAGPEMERGGGGGIIDLPDNASTRRSVPD